MRVLTWILVGAARTYRAGAGAGRTRSSTPGRTRALPVKIGQWLGWCAGLGSSSTHMSHAGAASLSRLNEEAPCKSRVSLHRSCTLVGRSQPCALPQLLVFPSFWSFFSPVAAFAAAPLPHPGLLSFCSDLCSGQVSVLRMAFPGRPAPLRVGPRPDAASPAPRVGPGLVGRGRFTLSAVTYRRSRRPGRRDLDGPGGPDAVTSTVTAVVIGRGPTAVKIFMRLWLQKFVPTVSPQPLVRVQARV